MTRAVKHSLSAPLYLSSCLLSRSLITSLRSISPIVRQLSYDDVIGYEEVKKSLRRILSFSSSSMKNKVARFGLKSPGGALLYGPPGTQHITAHHNTTHHNTTQHITTQHITTHHNKSQHTTPYNNENHLNNLRRTDAEFSSIARQRVLPDGTTAVIAIIHNRKIYVANAGDSRAIIVQKGGLARHLSVDHKPNRHVVFVLVLVLYLCLFLQSTSTDHITCPIFSLYTHTCVYIYILTCTNIPNILILPPMSICYKRARQKS